MAVFSKEVLSKSSSGKVERGKEYVDKSIEEKAQRNEVNRP